MMIGRFVRAAALTACLSYAAPMWAQSANWLHVEVNDGGEKSSKVNVNLPLSVAQAALNVAPKQFTEKFTDKAMEALNEHGISIADIRALWEQIKQAGNAEFVTVQEEDETISVARDGDWVRVRVASQGEKSEHVKVDIPIRVVDALLSGDGESFNLQAAVNELSGSAGDIVQVQDGDETVRVWIDAAGA